MRARMLFLLALFAFALAQAFVRMDCRAPIQEARTARYAGVLLDARSANGDERSFSFAIDRGPLVLVTLRGTAQPGTRTIIRGRLVPLDEARNPGETSERAIEAEHGITGRIENATLIGTDGDAPGLWALLARLRARAHDALALHLGEPDASIVAGELWGERAQLPPDLRAEFQQTGTVHVLVTAGLHVGCVAVLALALATLLGLPRTLACLAACIIVWGFALFSGLDLPALRAAVMMSMGLAARACGRSVVSWQTLAIAAVVVLLTLPWSVESPSFWLSFCCVGAIFSLASPLEHVLACLSLSHRVREALVLTLATQIGTWPLVAAMFERYSTYAVVGNLAVVPFVPLSMALGALQLFCTPLPPLAQMCANANAWVLAWTCGCVRVLASLPAASVVMTPAPRALIAAYEIAVATAGWLARRGGATASAALLLTTASLVLWPPFEHGGDLRIVALDVGQADSIVIETPARHAILVDAGGQLERGNTGADSSAERIGERIVVPFLVREGIHRLDALIISHPHGDHAGGCAPVVRSLHVAEIADSGQTYGGHAYHDCLDTAKADSVPIVYPRTGAVWRTSDGVTLTFIGPSLPFIGGKNAINDNSIAFILQYRSFRMLFTGDAGVAAEQRFLDEGVDLHADVLKVGHHGSAYSSSSSFIAAIRPRYGVISVGRHNLFGHPAPATISTLRRFGVTIFRTDQNGSLVIDVDSHTMSVVMEPSIPTLNQSDRLSRFR